MTNTFTVRSPCHPTAHLNIEMGWEGRQYLQYEVVTGFWCDEPGCNNEWDRDGNPV